jgi:hypothetical protein
MDTIKPSDFDEAAGPRLRAIADELRRLAPSRTDPHAYFQQKSDLFGFGRAYFCRYIASACSTRCGRNHSPSGDDARSR